MTRNHNLALAAPVAAGALDQAEKQAVEKWLQGKAAATQRQYRTTLQQFLEHCGCASIALACPNERLAELNLVSFAEKLSAGSAATKQVRLSALRVLLQHCAKRGVCPSVDWCVPSSAKPAVAPVLCPTEKQCFDAISLEPDVDVQFLMQLLYGTGLRIGEALAIKLEHIQREPDGRLTVYIVGKGSKARLVEICPPAGVDAPLLQPLGEALRKRGDAEDWRGWVFRPPLWEQSGAYRALRKAWARAGVTAIRNVIGEKVRFPGPHDWRRCHVTHVQERGATREQAQLQAGHTKPETTEGYSMRAPENPGRLLGRV